MSFNDFYILTTILAFCAIGLTFSSMSYFKNIFTQKIIFLNEQLAKFNNDAEIISYKIREFREFNINTKGGELYPPSIHSRFLINAEYKELVKEHEKYLRLSDKILKIIVKFFFSIMVVLGLFHIISKF